MTSPSEALCAQCQLGRPTAGCPACRDLREAHRLVALPHTAFRITMPETFTVLNAQPGVLVLQRKNEAWRGIVFIVLGVFVVGLTLFVGLASGTETLPFIVPLAIAALAGIFYGIHDIRYRQNITLDRGTLTVSPSKTTSGVTGILQFVVDAKHVAFWHKGLRWHTVYRLDARTNGASFPVFLGTHEEVRFVESKLEAMLGITDDPSRNVVTATGH